MANVDRPNGFRPAKSLLDSGWVGLVRQYNTDAAKAAGIGIGDAVILAADGNVEIAATNGTILGVAVGFGISSSQSFGETPYFDPDNLGKQHINAAEAGVVAVVPAEGVLFEVQSASDLDLAQGDAADILATAFDTTTGRSAQEITTSVNADVTVVEFVKSPDNDLTLANARYLVKFNDTENSI